MRWLVGLALWPTSAGSLWTAAWNFGRLAANPGRAMPFLFGFAAYLIAHHFWSRFSRVYVFGHELSHAVAAWMSGAKVLGFKIGKKSGHVDVSQSNAWIALAPYVVPIYALLLVGFYRLFLWAPPHPFFLTRLAHQFFLLGMGLAVSFHMMQTFDALWGQHQPDLDHAGGVMFSLAVIAFANGLFFVLALKCLFPGAVDVGNSVSMIWRFTQTCWTCAATPFVALVPWLRETWRA